jgi:hypothetical protein
MSTGLRPIRSESRPQNGPDQACEHRVGDDDQGDVEATATESRRDEGQDRDHDPEADHVQQHHGKQQQPWRPGPLPAALIVSPASAESAYR